MVNGWLVRRVQDDFIPVPVTLVDAAGRLGSTGPPFPCSPSNEAVGLLPWPLRAPRAKVHRDAKREWSASWARGPGAEKAQVPSTLPFCWLTLSPSQWGSKGGDADFPLLQRECQRICGHLNFSM